MCFFFFFSSRRRHTRLQGDWSSDVCSSDLPRQTRLLLAILAAGAGCAALDRAVVRVSRNAAADPVLRNSRGDGLQCPLREDAVLPVLSVGHTRVANEHSRQREREAPLRSATRGQRRRLLAPASCLTSPPRSGARWTVRRGRCCASAT